SGSVILVCCHCQPPRLLSLKPHSIQLLIPYHATSATSGARSVTISQGSAYWSSQRASRVQVRRHSRVTKQSTTPLQPVPTRGAAAASGRKCRAAWGRNCPP